ncbi:protein kinase [Streptomyces sp. NPDC006655]|uniref:protein kinase domain-containing protein n=1 Tax=Streptomyces sp. NPDC006655 TaxID=3156898 RepID=UPI003452ED4F
MRAPGIRFGRPWRLPGFREVRELGDGTAGRVVLAVDDATGTPVVIRYLSDRLLADLGFRQQFRGEVSMLTGLRSPYTARVYSYVEHGGTAALVTEPVRGPALHSVLLHHGALPPEAALTLFKGLLLGLAAAHRLGIVHRACGTETVLISTEGDTKLVDFGLTGRGATPAASPERDISSATAVLYEALDGRPPGGSPDLGEFPESLRLLARRGLSADLPGGASDAGAFVTEVESAGDQLYGPGWEQRGRQALAEAARSVGVESDDSSTPTLTDPPVSSASESAAPRPRRFRMLAAWLASVAVAGGAAALWTLHDGAWDESHSSSPARTGAPFDYSVVRKLLAQDHQTIVTGPEKTGSPGPLRGFYTVCSGSMDGHCGAVSLFAGTTLVWQADATYGCTISQGGTSVAFTCPQYRPHDALAGPTGGNKTFRFRWNGRRAVPDQPPPKSANGSYPDANG